MTLHAPMLTPEAVTSTAAALATVKAELASGRIVPYLGPGVLAERDCSIPLTPAALALALQAKVAVPGRIRSNLWATAQFIESRRHRKTLTAAMTEIFRAPVPPTDLHRSLARLPVPLIVDTWYDGAMRTALRESGRTDWGEVQGISRAGESRNIWTRFYDACGAEVDSVVAAIWKTILYKPHGSSAPAANYLISDADYVEVLTEIDIQTPIPDIVKERRRTCGFLFIGARFDDQTLRIFARQITKRSAGPHLVIAERADLTRNEIRFLSEAAIDVVECSPAAAIEFLAGG